METITFDERVHTPVHKITISQIEAQSRAGSKIESRGSEGTGSKLKRVLTANNRLEPVRIAERTD
jgi:hypothetical protein